MSRLIDEPVTVHIKNDMPGAFIWRRRNYRVIEIVSRWWEPAQWWNGEKAHFFIQLLAVNRATTGIYELAKQDSGWFLHRVLD